MEDKKTIAIEGTSDNTTRDLVGEMTEEYKRQTEKYYNNFFEDTKQKKLRKKPTNITPKKKKRK